MPETEIESKLEVDPSDFAHLTSTCTLESLSDRINIYYDAQDIIARHGGVLRIRLRPQCAPIMTFKMLQRIVGERREALEIEADLAKPDSYHPRALRLERDLPDPIRLEARRLSVSRFERLGALRTQRWVARTPAGACIELDAGRLPDGRRFFEVEFEHPDPQEHERVVQEVRSLAPSARASRMGKYARFLHALEIPARRKQG